MADSSEILDRTACAAYPPLQAESQPMNDLAVVPVKPSDDADPSRQPNSTQPLTDEGREIAIIRAGKLVEFFMAEHQAAEALWMESGYMADKGAADGAKINAQCALGLMQKLTRGRSAAQLMRMAQAQAERMAREPGAEIG